MADTAVFQETEADYRAGLRAVVRSVWAGIIPLETAFGTFRFAVARSLTRAFMEGMLKCGIKPDEVTFDETQELQQIIRNEQRYIFGFLVDVEAGQRGDGLLRDQYARVEMWVGRWETTKLRAETLGCGNKKKIWVIDPTKDNCPTCLKLSGKVKRLKTWQAANLIPPTPGQNTDCQGWKCGCRLKDTNLPVSRGPLPKMSPKKIGKGGRRKRR